MSLLQDRIDRPVHMGPLHGANAVGAVGNPACGDVVTIYLRIGDTIEEACFESMGSKYQLATASVLCDCVLGQTLEQARKRTPDCVLEKLPDLPKRNRYLARLALEALHSALDRYEHGPDVADDDLEVLTAEEARAFILDLLAGGRTWRTLEVEAMAQADEKRFPGGAAKCLSTLRKEGRIVGEMDVAHQQWTWSINPASPAP